MWSHTIKSPAQKSTNPPTQRPARADTNLKKKDDPATIPEEDMTRGFDADGFSKTSKVHASKKPLTVAKAPSFGRTTSRVGQTTTGEINTPHKDSQNSSTQVVKPSQPSKAGTPARFPQTATPTSSRAAKAGTPLKNKTIVTRPKETASGGRLTKTSTQSGERSPGSEIAAPEVNTHRQNELEQSPADSGHSKSESDVADVSKAKETPGHQASEELKHTMAVKDGGMGDLQAEIQDLRSKKDAEIQELRAQVKEIQTRNEQKSGESGAAFLTLQSEGDDARRKISDLEATHRKTQEEHSKVLHLKDEEIRKLSETAHGQRGEQDVKESVLSLKDEFQRLQTKHKRELDEAAAKASARVEENRVEQDELLKSRDREVKELSDLVQELQKDVEKAHQAERDEIKEAEEKHERELQDKVAQHEQELRDSGTKHQQALRDDALQHEQELRVAAMKKEELQEKVSHLEHEIQDAAAKHMQEMNDANKESQTLLRGATQKHEQQFRDKSSQHQQEMEDLMMAHHEEIKIARTRNEQASEESAAEHRRETEALIVKHKEEIETAAARQELALEDAAAKYQQESQSLEAKHLEELKIATTKDEQDSGSLASKHEQEIQALTAKHQEELGKIIKTNEQQLGNAAIESQQAIEAIIMKQQGELTSAVSQIEDLGAAAQRHQQELGDVAISHEQELERVKQKHQQELHEVASKHDQELEEVKAQHKVLEEELIKKDDSLREVAGEHEKEIAQLQRLLETATGSVTSLETTLRDLSLQKEDVDKEAASKHEQELRTATLEHKEELQSLRNIYATAVEEITTLNVKLQGLEQKRSGAEQELESLRTVHATAVEEIAALKRKMETVDQKRSEAIDETTSLRASLDGLDVKRGEALRQLTSLQSIMKDGELERSEAAVEIALLRDKLELADRRFEQDQQAVTDLQRQIRGLETQISEISTDTTLDQTEAAVDAALLKDRLELADLEIHLHKGTISALQNEIEKLQTQLAESSTDTKLDQNEAIVDVTLLKDKLELADIQIRQAKGTVSNLQEEIEGLKVQITDSTVGIGLNHNEAAVEMALLKNTLEHANLESHQDKATIKTLQKQLEGLQAPVGDTPKTGSYTCQQLRGELSMLERHHAAQMTDLESLKADMAAENELREREWKKSEDVWDRFASEMEELKTQLEDPVDVELKQAVSSD